MERLPDIRRPTVVARNASMCAFHALFPFFSLNKSQIHFFGHLTLAHVISVDSFTALIQSFTAVLDEFGVSLGRAKRASLCAGEGLIIVCTLTSTNIYANVWQAGSVLPPPTVSSILAAIDTFNESTASAKSLTNPSSNLSGSSSTSEENADEVCPSAPHVQFVLISPSS